MNCYVMNCYVIEQAMASKTTTERSDADEDNRVLATIPCVKGASERVTQTLRQHHATHGPQHYRRT